MKRLFTLLLLAAPSLFGVGPITSVSPNSGIVRPSQLITFTVTASLQFGPTQQIIFGAWNTPACVVALGDTQWALLNDANSDAVSAPVVYSVPTTFTNSQCSVSGMPGAGWPGDGGGTISFKINFNVGWQGTKPMYTTNGGLTTEGSNLTSAGSININANTAPVAVSITGVPANVNYGVWFTATSTCRDAEGYADMTGACRTIIGWGVSDSETCDLIFWPTSNAVGLLNDAGSSWQEQVAGTVTTISRSVCFLDIGNTTTTRSGTDATANYRIMFRPAYLTHPAIQGYLLAADAAVNSGWQTLGSSGTLRSGPKLIVTTNR